MLLKGLQIVNYKVNLESSRFGSDHRIGTIESKVITR